MIGRPVKVSIVVPVYNVSKYLSTCLCSCINQTLYDIEIVCVNDGSTDNSLEILEAFAAQDHRVKIINKPNGGLASARNAGIKNACGEIIMFLDSDDLLSLNACERVWRETLEAPTDIIVFGTEIFPAMPKASDWYYKVLATRTHRYWKFEPHVLFNEPAAKPFVWRQAFNRKFFKEKGMLFDERVRYGEDIVFQMEIFPHAETFAFIEDKLYLYRWCREGSLMESYRTDMDGKIREHLTFVRYITEYWQKHGWLEKYGKEYTQWLLEFFVYDCKNPEANFAQEHLGNLKKMMVEFSLDKYIKEMPAKLQILVKAVETGYV